MNPTETFSPSPTYIGHVRNGVIVLDQNASLNEGQTVRVEPVASPTMLDADRMERVRKLQSLFEQWTEEDAQLSIEEADRLRLALDQSQGLQFGVPELP